MCLLVCSQCLEFSVAIIFFLIEGKRKLRLSRVWQSGIKVFSIHNCRISFGYVPSASGFLLFGLSLIINRTFVCRIGSKLCGISFWHISSVLLLWWRVLCCRFHCGWMMQIQTQGRAASTLDGHSGVYLWPAGIGVTDVCLPLHFESHILINDQRHKGTFTNTLRVQR